MQVNIKLQDSTRAGEVLKSLFSIINNDDELQKQILDSGIILDGLKANELAECTTILQQLKYQAFKAPATHLHLFAQDKRIGSLLGTIGSLVIPDELREKKQNLIRIITTCGITLVGISKDKALKMKKLLERLGVIVTLTDPSAETPKPDPDEGQQPPAENQQGVFVVSGTVMSDEGMFLSGLIVKAFDKDMRSEQLLGEATTNTDGHYSIRYTEKQFRNAEKGSADLFIRVSDRKGELLASSDVFFNAPERAVINLVIQLEQEKGISEWERFHTILKPLREGVEVGVLTDDDLHFLFHETGISTEHLDFLRLDAQWSRQFKIPDAIFYGLLRMGLPPAMDSLLKVKPTQKYEALKNALSANIIPSELEKMLDGIMERLRDLAVENSFDTTWEGIDEVPLGLLLGGTGIGTDTQRKIVDFVLSYEGEENIWNVLPQQAGLEEKEMNDLRFTFDASVLLSGHLPSIRVIQQYQQSHRLGSIRDLAALDLQGWNDLLANLSTDQLPEGINNTQEYATALAGAIEQAFPSAVLANRISNDKELGSHDLKYFLSVNPGFDFLLTPVDQFFADGADTGQINNIESLKTELKTLQRVAQISPEKGRYSMVKGLLQVGFDSAFKIATTSPDDFFAAVSPFSTKADSEIALRNSVWRHNESQLLHLGIRDHWSDIPFVIPGFVFPEGSPSSELPDWVGLFGSLGNCTCKHCRSVNSPAAYLVDLLQFLKRAPRAVGGQSLVNVLRQRRPDLEQILLNCDNAHTPIPYIDLVNETLERLVTGSLTGPFYQTQGSTALEKARLRTFPANENENAYNILSGAHHPWVLPFELNWEKIFLWDEQLKLRLHSFRAIFDSPREEQARLYFKMNPQEWGLITQQETDPVVLALNWGLGSTNDWDPAIPAVLKQTMLDYPELEDLLTSWFFAEYELGIDVSADPCDYLQHRMERPSDEVLDLMHRFLRLKLKLGWKIKKLDTVLENLNIRELTTDDLVNIWELLSLSEKLNVDPIRLSEIINNDTEDLLAGLAVLTRENLRALRTFYRISGIDFTDATNRFNDLNEFINSWRVLQHSGMDVYELAWILRHEDLIPAVYQPLDDAISVQLAAIHQAAAELRNDRLNAVETRIERALQEVLAAIPEGTSPENTGIALEEARVQEMAIIEMELELETEDLIIEHLAGFLGADPLIVDALLRTEQDEDGTMGLPSVLYSVADEDEPAIRDWLAFAGTPEPDEDMVNQFYSLLTRLNKVVRVVRNAGLTSSELRVMSILPKSSGFPDFNLLQSIPSDEPSFSSWEKLVRAKALQRSLPASETHIFDWIGMALSGGYSTEQFLGELGDATGWNIDQETGEVREIVPLLFDALFPGADTTVLGQVTNYERLQEAVMIIRRFRTTPEIILSIAGGTSTDLPDILMDLSRHQYTDDTSWYTAITPSIDRLREKKRDALLAYSLTRPQLDGTGNPLWQDVNELYAHLLLDVEMNACQLTSRIVQATNAIQQFVQRARMSLEPLAMLGEQGKSAHWKQWEWMKNYRVWEANRKVFLFPENWIEPDLRLDSSPFFRELTQELLQGEINTQNITGAYENYFTKLDEVSRLDIRGMFEERNSSAGSSTVHVIGRTFNEPGIYFFRKRLPDRRWTAWERIEIGIDGIHLLPVVVNGRLILFWPRFREVESGRFIGDQAIKVWEVHLAWSEYKNKNWQAIKESKETISLILLPETSFTFRLINNDGIYTISIFQQQFPNRRGNNINVSTALPVGFELDFCDGEVVVSTSGVKGLLLHPDRTDLKAMKFIENRTNGDRLAVTPVAANNLLLNIDNDAVENFLELMRTGGLGGVLVGGLGLAALVKSHLREIQDRSIELLRNTPGTFKVTVPNHYRQFNAYQPFFLEMDKRSWFVSHRSRMELVQLNIPSRTTRNPSNAERLLPGLGLTIRDFPVQVIPEMVRFYIRIRNWYEFESFYHPFYCEMVERFNTIGFDGLLKAPRSDFRIHRQLFKEGQRYSDTGQLLPILGFPRFAFYGPTEAVWRKSDDSHHSLPYEQYDFTYDGAYSVYNWELFFHIPLLVADRLSKNQRFEDAQKWFHYIFDPTDFSVFRSPAKYWQIKPLFELARLWEGPAETLQQLMLRLNAGSEDLEKQVNAWRNDPFNPHLIAGMRLAAYMKTVVQKYLDNLIAWGDHLFSQDTMESVNEATQLYVLAAQILGQRPVAVKRPVVNDLTYAQMESQLDSFSNALVEIESFLPPSVVPQTDADGTEIPMNMLLYFCIPSNEKLIGYWDTIEDRLFKIRNCMNLEGQQRQLSLFAPPIDPALLVRARAMGLDIGTALNTLVNTGLPHYRYRVLADKAMVFCNDLRALGSSLLSALEKRENADLTLLRARLESSLLAQAGQLNDMKIDEARLVIDGLRVSLNVAANNLDYYDSKEFMYPSEIAEIESLELAFVFGTIGRGFSTSASLLHLIPDVTAGMSPGATFGGSNLGDSFKGMANLFDMISKGFDFSAKMSGLVSRYQQRMDGWKQQSKLAAFEVKRLEKLILAAEIKLDMAIREKALQEQKLKDALEVEAFHKSRFTSAELYGWMTGHVSGMYYQAYKLAVDLARKAEAAARFELGVSAADFSFIDYGHWESHRRGLLAGERLQQNLRRLDAAYLDKNKREYELTKQISLADVNPLAFIALRETSQCQLEIPEVLFDLDHPGHFMRRLKSVNLTIHCVAGSNTSVGCKLTLLSSSTRINSTRPDQYPRDMEDEDNRFVTQYAAIQSIATSHSQKDSGLFELSFRDERYLPFEGAGAVSLWRLELSGKWGDIEFPQFDFMTISDVVLEMRYTARDGGERLKAAAAGNLRTALNEMIQMSDQGGLLRMISLANELSVEWMNFITSPSHTLHGISITRDHFPVLARSRNIDIQSTLVFISGQNTPLPHHTIGLSGNMNSGWTLNINIPGEIDLTTVQDVFVVFHYRIA